MASDERIEIRPNVAQNAATAAIACLIFVVIGVCLVFGQSGLFPGSAASSASCSAGSA